MTKKQCHTVAIKLHTYMMENNLNDSIMGNRLGLSEETFLHVLAAHNVLTQGGLENIAKLLGVSISDLLD